MGIINHLAGGQASLWLCLLMPPLLTGGAAIELFSDIGVGAATDSNRNLKTSKALLKS